MRLLWSLPRVAPILLRHLAAYAELAEQDLTRTRRDLSTQVIAAVVIGVSAFFVVLSGCLVVVALTWDTPHRVAAIVVLGAVFLTVAVIASVYRASALKDQVPFLDTVRREWREDREILERALSEQKD